MKKHNIIVGVKLRGCDEYIEAEPTIYDEFKLHRFETLFNDIENMKNLSFTLNDGSRVWVNPTDISYINIRYVLSFKEKLLKLLTFKK